MEVLNRFKTLLYKEVLSKNLLSEPVSVKARVLTPAEAIGNPERKDFPLLKGKEKMVQAEFKGSVGQAFTDQPGNFEGRLKDVFSLSLTTNYERAIFISTANAVARYLGISNGTIHCKNEEPEICSEMMVKHIAEKHGKDIKIGIIGYQPALIEHFASSFNDVKVIDMDADNIGQNRYGIKVLDAETFTESLIKDADIILCTGTTIVNDTIDRILELAKGKQLYFYGTTISAVAAMLNLNRLCFKSR